MPFTETKHPEAERETQNCLQIFDALSKTARRVYGPSVIIDTFGQNPLCETPTSTEMHSHSFLVDYRGGKYYIGCANDKDDVWVEVHKPIQLISSMEFKVANTLYEVKLSEASLHLLHRGLGRSMWVRELPHPFITCS